MKATSKSDIDKTLMELDGNRGVWPKMDLAGVSDLIRTLLKDLIDCAEEWALASFKAKGVTRSTEGQGQEWLGGPGVTLRNLRLLGKSIGEIAENGKPVIPGPVTTRPDGQVVAQVFPNSFYDSLFFMGTTAEVWMQSGVTETNLKAHMATAYSGDKETTDICLVLGAGNVSSITPMDCFYKLFVERKLVVLKMHPVKAYLGPIFEKGCRALIERGFMKLIYGDVEEGKYLCNHKDVDEIHITGSDRTHDLIVFGPEVEKQKAAREPLNTRPISSELGNVSPMIVVPGVWTQKELKFQAENIVSSLANNAGFNCNATRVIVTQKDWPQREALLDEIRTVFKSMETRSAYYPGAGSRFEAFKEAHPGAELYGLKENGALPWMFIPDVDPADENNICFKKEAFCSLFSESALEASDTKEFLKKAVDFSNDVLWGTLSASLVISPKTLKEPGVSEALDQAVANLRFGTVSINHWAAIGYALCSTTWGAYPGHDIYDIRSGKDVVHNTLMFDKVQKSVVRGPFMASPKPAWFVTHKKSPVVGRKMASFEAEPSLLKVPGLVLSAFQG